MIKAILFDCFGVLVGKGYFEIYEIAGGNLAKDRNYVEEMLNKANSGTISSDEFRNIMAKRLGLSFEEYRQLININEQPDTELFEFIKKELKPKYKIALVNNVNSGVIERKIPTDLRRLFDLEVISAEVGFLKPDPQVFKHTVEKLEINYDEALFTDDQERYLLPAAELGMKTILYKDFVSFKSELSTLLS